MGDGGRDVARTTDSSYGYGYGYGYSHVFLLSARKSLGWVPGNIAKGHKRLGFWVGVYMCIHGAWSVGP